MCRTWRMTAAEIRCPPPENGGPPQIFGHDHGHDLVCYNDHLLCSRSFACTSRCLDIALRHATPSHHGQHQHDIRWRFTQAMHPLFSHPRAGSSRQLNASADWADTLGCAVLQAVWRQQEQEVGHMLLCYTSLAFDSRRTLTKQLLVVLRAAPSPPGDAQNPAGLGQHLDVIRVELLLGHAVHHRHELLDSHLALLV